MSLSELAAQGWSPVVDSSGNARAGLAFTLRTAAGVDVPIFSTSAGVTALITAEKVTGARGTVPGYAAPGPYVFTVEGRSTDVFVVGAAVYDVKAHGAVGDGVTDDSTAIQAAITAAMAYTSSDTDSHARGAVVTFPASSSFYKHATKLNLDAAKNVRLEGQATQGGGSAKLYYTGTGTAISAQASRGFSIRNLYVASDTAAIIIDLSKGAGASDTTLWSISGCDIRGLQNVSSTTYLVKLTKAWGGTIEKCSLLGGAYAVVGRLANTDYSNSIVVRDNYFQYQNTTPIVNPYQNWLVTGNVFEPLLSGNGAALSCDSGLPLMGLTYIGNSHQDGGASGVWVQVRGGSGFGGFTALGNFFSTGDKAIKFLTAFEGAVIQGNTFDTLATAEVDFNSQVVANCVLSGNTRTTGTLRYTGTGSVNLPASVASATTITLPPEGDVFTVTGTTNITSITAARGSRRVTLVFAGILTLTDGSNLKLAGDFVTTADDAITLVSDGTSWFETGRAVS